MSSSQQIGWVFPGQGSQFVGMGQDWADAFEAARLTFEEADDILGFSLSTLCWNGPAEELQLTANTQPAILTCSIAMLRSIEHLLGRPLVAAGHSLGEYSALVATKALSFDDALRLVRRRGQLMQDAVAPGEGAMAALIGVDGSRAAEVAAEASAATGAAHDSICSVANYNSPRQTVIAGAREAVERAISIAKSQGVRRAVMLPVSAPFHSPMMAPAREGLTPDLVAAEFSDPIVPVVSNVDARPMTTGTEARDALIRQIDGPVRWVDSVQAMIGDLDAGLFLEIGAGKVLCGLGRQINRQVTWQPTPSADEAVEMFAKLSDSE